MPVGLTLSNCNKKNAPTTRNVPDIPMISKMTEIKIELQAFAPKSAGPFLGEDDFLP